MNFCCKMCLKSSPFPFHQAELESELAFHTQCWAMYLPTLFLVYLLLSCLLPVGFSFHVFHLDICSTPMYCRFLLAFNFSTYWEVPYPVSNHSCYHLWYVFYYSYFPHLILGHCKYKGGEHPSTMVLVYFSSRVYSTFSIWVNGLIFVLSPDNFLPFYMFTCAYY